MCVSVFMCNICVFLCVFLCICVIVFQIESIPFVSLMPQNTTLTPKAIHKRYEQYDYKLNDDQIMTISWIHKTPIMSCIA